MTASNACIWCLRIGRPPAREHIIPEVLGCPEDFILESGEVCRCCNNGLGHLDSALADFFELQRLWVGQKGKRGKLPAITSRGNLKGIWTPQGPELAVNAGPQKVRAGHYGILSAPSGKSTDVKVDFRKGGNIANVKVSVVSGGNLKVCRALHKIALESIVKMVSWEFALESQFNPIREYVTDGKGRREVLVIVPSAWEYYHQFGQLHRDDRGFLVLEFILCGLNIFVDLSPSQTHTPQVKAMLRDLYGDQGWTWLPTEAS